MKRKFLYAILIIIITILILVSFLIYNIGRNDPKAEIYKDGKLIKTIELSENMEPVEFTVTGENGEKNNILAENGSIRVISASCPDKICVNQGFISDGVVPIVCLPNRLVIEIKGGEDQADAASGR